MLDCILLYITIRTNWPKYAQEAQIRSNGQQSYEDTQADSTLEATSELELLALEGQLDNSDLDEVDIHFEMNASTHNILLQNSNSEKDGSSYRDTER